MTTRCSPLRLNLCVHYTSNPKMEIIKKTRNKKEASKASITDAFKASFIKSNYIWAPMEFSCMDDKSYLFCNVTRT